MKTVLVLFALLYSVFCIGQDSLSVAERIADHPFSEYDLLSKGRRLLTECFEKGNIEEVKDIIRYLDDEIYSESYIALWPAERLLGYSGACPPTFDIKLSGINLKVC